MLLLDLEQGTPEWKQARMGIPTASEFGRIITKSGKPSASAHAYMAELIDEIVRPWDSLPKDEQDRKFTGNYHTERGHELEPQARSWFRIVMGMDVRQIGFVMRDDRLAGCSPDSLIYTGDDPVAGLEIKAPEGKKHVMWMLDKKLPDEHVQQVHGSMAITGLKTWWFMSFCPGYKPFTVKAEWNKYTDEVAKQVDGFVASLEKAKGAFIDYLPQREAA